MPQVHYSAWMDDCNYRNQSIVDLSFFDLYSTVCEGLSTTEVRYQSVKQHYIRSHTYTDRRVYHIVTDNVFWVESIVTFHQISPPPQKKKVYHIVTDNFVNL